MSKYNTYIRRSNTDQKIISIVIENFSSLKFKNFIRLNNLQENYPKTTTRSSFKKHVKFQFYVYDYKRKKYFSKYRHKQNVNLDDKCNLIKNVQYTSKTNK